MQARTKVEKKKHAETISSNNSYFANCSSLPAGIGRLAVTNNPICEAPTMKNEEKKKYVE
jgi:hypothetical protein